MEACYNNDVTSPHVYRAQIIQSFHQSYESYKSYIFDKSPIFSYILT